MQKLREFLSKLNIPMAGFILVTLSGVVRGFGIGEAIAMFAFSGLYGTQLYFEYRKKEVASAESEKTMLTRLENLESRINVVQMTSGIKAQRHDENAKRLF